MRAKRNSLRRNRSSKRKLNRLSFEKLEERRLLASYDFSFVDANNNGIFNEDTDVVLMAGEVEDGAFDTQTAEGAYQTVITGAGLYIGGSAINVGSDLAYAADGDLTINTNLTAGDELSLQSRSGSVALDDPTISAPDEIEIEAALDILSTDDVIEATGNRSEVALDAGRDIFLIGTLVEADREVNLRAGGDIGVFDSEILEALIAARDDARGAVSLRAGGNVNVSSAYINAGDNINLRASGNIFGFGASLSATGNPTAEIELRAAGEVNMDDAFAAAARRILMRSTSENISLVRAALQATASSRGDIELRSGRDLIFEEASMLAFDDIDLRARQDIRSTDDVIAGLGSGSRVRLIGGHDVFAVGTLIDSVREIRIRASGTIGVFDSEAKQGGLITSSTGQLNLLAGENINVSTAELDAGRRIKLKAGNDIYGFDAAISTSSSAGRIKMKAGGNVFLENANVDADRNIKVKSAAGLLDATGATISADKVVLSVALDAIICFELVQTDDLKLSVGGDILEGDC